jgi:hypothetical protein
MEENQKLVEIALDILYVFKKEAYFRALYLEIETAKGSVFIPKGISDPMLLLAASISD